MQSAVSLTSRDNLSDALVNELRHRIVDGRLPAGERINEVHLSAALGVSRTPLREALNRLAQEGALIDRPRIGYSVRPLTLEDSVAPHRRVSPETTGRHGDDFMEIYLDGYDAYAWHLSDIASGGRVYHAYFANGAGGQLLVVPELDLACMFTAGNYGQGIWLYLRDSIVGKEIMPAVRG